MKSFSTAALVAALALVVPSALAANIVSVTKSYSSSDCSGSAYNAEYTNYVVASGVSESVAASACTLAIASSKTCTADDDGGSIISMCTDSIDMSSGSGYVYYNADDTTCSKPGYASIDYISCQAYGDDSYKASCTSSAYEYSYCSASKTCGGSCVAMISYPFACTLSDEMGYYETAFCASSDDVCFSGDDTLTLESGEAKRLSEVAIGDKVQTADANGVLSFSEVVALPHAANNKLASFVNVATTSGKSVKATKMHLLQQCDGSLAYAGSLTAGDCLRTADGDEAVTAVSMTTAEGIYTAVTNNEFLVVNGIVASPFAVTHGLTNAYYNVHRFVAKVFPSALKSPLVLAANAFLGGAFLTAGGSK